ncbi:BON domain-containing protein [Stenomitos frigidus]|uniref:Transporter n=1 Tax=Stenomitos frigidus ULC18 TaxID=2107698 RepID=A0A2T1E296_9CYAN|nr:BON domain-containing protein [Stenomitos frigidus]PSB26859.1 transporter [Stenomitos frigidus ULC18]
MKKIIPLLLGGFLLVSTAACNNAKTTSDAPNSTDTNGQVPKAQDAKTAQNDATSDVRKKQMESDIRAREQRNDAGGDQMKRADGDLESEVRTKLEANIPNGKLTVNAKNGDVTVAGTVPVQAQLAKIEPLSKQIKGVKNVAVKATVAAPAEKK